MRWISGLAAVFAALLATGGAFAAERGEAGMCRVSREAYGKLPEPAWAPRATETAAHKALRERLGGTMPTGGTYVLLHITSSHQTKAEFSVVAVRSAGGVWSVDRVGEESGNLMSIPTQAFPIKAWTLSAESGKALDKLLADPCLYSEPDLYFDSDNMTPGMIFTDIEIVTPGHRRLAVQAGDWKGVTGDVVRGVTDEPAN